MPCTATVLHNGIGPIFGGGFVFRKGEVLREISGFHLEDGLTYYCQYKSACFPEKIRKNGKYVSAAYLNNCRVDFSRPYRGYGETIYELKIIRSRFSARELRLLDMEDAFLRQGIDSVYAEAFAQAAVEHPKSACARLARRVMRGDERAIDEMNDYEQADDDGFLNNPCLILIQ